MSDVTYRGMRRYQVLRSAKADHLVADSRQGKLQTQFREQARRPGPRGDYGDGGFYLAIAGDNGRNAAVTDLDVQDPDVDVDVDFGPEFPGLPRIRGGHEVRVRITRLWLVGKGLRILHLYHRCQRFHILLGDGAGVDAKTLLH